MEETQNMNPDRQQYLDNCRTVSPLIAFLVAVMRRVPKQYEQEVVTLLRVHPQIVETQVLETTTSWLGIIWECQATEVPTLLQGMTARSHGAITYSLGAQQPGLGCSVRLAFTMPEAMEEQA
jgi:hypothetical protein